MRDAKLLTTDVLVIAYQETGTPEGFIQSVDVSGTPTLGADELSIASGAGTDIHSLAVASTTRLIALYNSSFDVALISSDLSPAPAGFGLTHSSGGIPGVIIP